MTPTVELEWGPVGARTLAQRCDVVVVVDVLSFTTSLTLAVGQGAVVWPYVWDDGADELARAVGAELVRGRSSGARLTLSPATLMDLEPGARLVMPSPNGAAIAHAAVASARPLVAASLRNASAVAAWVGSVARIGLVPAGERWRDGSLRPAYEDLLGAGVVAARLAAAGAVLSPDAAAAAAVAAVPRALADCPSGRELVEMGFAEDLRLAEALDVDTVVPELRDGRFIAGGSTTGSPESSGLVVEGQHQHP